MKTKNEILEERATRTAGKPPTENEKNKSLETVLQLSLYPDTFAIRDRYITEVFSLTEITPLPGTPACIMGVVNRRGKVLCIINLKPVLNIKSIGLTEMNKIICLKKGLTEFGIVADSLPGMSKIDLTKLNKDTLLKTMHTGIIEGIMPDGLQLIDDEELLTSKLLIAE